ncbi:acyltransferase family protein [Leifsonia shinshuensis]|uniref:Acyltransferase n=1 Tax=Leifsonia shinshuensis TaxID=150026 RepID=A0A7G6Y826_9MICO|nr:acyltransferase [Leifsonia shinshuensis]QNE34641.1 acyltransferase [Leifsonia shinshuensis]
MSRPDLQRTPSARPKDTSVQALRGIACILVVVWHSVGLGELSLWRFTSDSAWEFALGLLEYLRMPLFTFLSGYVYAMRPISVGASPWRFLRSKARRLLVPMLVVGTAYILAFDLIPGWGGSGLRPFWTWHIIPVAHLWFIWAVLWCFVAVAVLDARGRLSTRRGMLIALVVSFALSAVLPKGIATPFASAAAVYLSFFFLAGMACRRFDWRSAPRRRHLIALGAFVVLFAVTILGTVAGVRPSPDGVVGNLVGALFCALVVLVRFSSRPLEWLGARSFAIFLFHYFAVQFCRMAFVALGFHDVTVCIVVTTVVALLASVVLERILRSWRVTRTLALGERWTAAT